VFHFPLKIMSYNPNDSRPMEIQIIRSAIQESHQRRIKAGVTDHRPEARPSIFTIRTGNEWMQQEKDKPAPRMLFGNFWYENELCILFADTNMGKSILAVQLGDSISKNMAIEPFELHAERTNVLYIDFELSAKQFEVRNAGRRNHAEFNRSFFRAEFNTMAIVPPDYEDYQAYLNYAVDHAVSETKAKVLIIDNITCLCSGTERAKDALPLMKHLKELKSKYDLSILVLAHTPKRDPGKPIGRNDLQGSKMLINFADSAFAIGESQTKPGLRYLKQVKQRSSSEMYGANNICLCRIDDRCGFLRYQFIGNGTEYDHLRKQTRQEETERLFDRIKPLLDRNRNKYRIGYS
jgi:hypothetical protein